MSHCIGQARRGWVDVRLRQWRCGSTADCERWCRLPVASPPAPVWRRQGEGCQGCAALCTAIKEQHHYDVQWLHLRKLHAVYILKAQRSWSMDIGTATTHRFHVRLKLEIWVIDCLSSSTTLPATCYNWCPTNRVNLPTIRCLQGWRHVNGFMQLLRPSGSWNVKNSKCLLITTTRSWKKRREGKWSHH